LATSPLSVVTIRCPGGTDFAPVRHCVAWSSETEKRLAAMLCRPWFYWSLNGLMLFQAVRGGIESVWVLDRSRGPITPRILTLDLIRSEYTDDDRVAIYRPAGKPFRTAMSSNSVSSDRTFLLSSRFSARWPRSCEPVSAAPSLCECPCSANPASSLDRVRSGFRP
jgi:hypothetical protein